MEHVGAHILETTLVALAASGRQVLLALGPLALVTGALRLLERALSGRLASRLGWHSVLLTAWLGVPVHELSHAAACLLFGHRVERLRLLAPDSITGQLGSVDHAWDRRSLYQQVGRFFIGIAPLLGGALALLLLTLLLGPAPVRWPDLPDDGGLLSSLQSAGRLALDLAAAMFSPHAARSGLTWLYLYLALCIGAHMAPSTTDLRGSVPGLLWLLLFVLGSNLVAALLGADPSLAEHALLVALTPLLALLLTALVLDVLCLVVVVLVTALLPRRAA
ncbi:MAG TPA: hypothetical protein VK824_02505 [Planctomycetota bacterium]|nr:hypothetical protein [Planctomycetota bacterium]